MTILSHREARLADDCAHAWALIVEAMAEMPEWVDSGASFAPDNDPALSAEYAQEWASMTHNVGCACIDCSFWCDGNLIPSTETQVS